MSSGPAGRAGGEPGVSDRCLVIQETTGGEKATTGTGDLFEGFHLKRRRKIGEVK